MVKEFIRDATDAQERGQAFHYSWLLILISFIAWSEPEYYQGVNLEVPYQGARYQNLCFEKEHTK